MLFIAEYLQSAKYSIHLFEVANLERLYARNQFVLISVSDWHRDIWGGMSNKYNMASTSGFYKPMFTTVEVLDIINHDSDCFDNVSKGLWKRN